jgi:hypothetical protein
MSKQYPLMENVCGSSSKAVSQKRQQRTFWHCSQLSKHEDFPTVASHLAEGYRQCQRELRQLLIWLQQNAAGASVNGTYTSVGEE